jgi:hypothetical protein
VASGHHKPLAGFALRLARPRKLARLLPLLKTRVRQNTVSQDLLVKKQALRQSGADRFSLDRRALPGLVITVT